MGLSAAAEACNFNFRVLPVTPSLPKGSSSHSFWSLVVAEESMGPLAALGDFCWFRSVLLVSIIVMMGRVSGTQKACVT